MDSVTQFLLGASIGGAMMGRKIGVKSLLIGGVVATLPDFDSLVIRGDVIDMMTYHRGFSHSVIVQTLAAPAIAYGLTRVSTQLRAHWKLLWLTLWLVFVTHSLLDSLTAYGTQVFWPLNFGPPVAVPAVFIIDPIYTLMLFFGVTTMYFRRSMPDRGLRLNCVLLALSTLYLGLGLAGHMTMKARAADHPAFTDSRLHVQPTPFNILFWQIIGLSGDHYARGYGSVLPGCPITSVTYHDRAQNPPENVMLGPSSKRLIWFTDGFYNFTDEGKKLMITDLRVGVGQMLPFSFEIARKDKDEEGYQLIEPRKVPLDQRGSAEMAEVLAKARQNLAACNW